MGTTSKWFATSPEPDVTTQWTVIFLATMAIALPAWGDEASDTQALIQRARDGDAQSQFTLGSAYEIGKGVQKDPNEALVWYQAAATQGYAEAQNTVGSILQAKKNYSEALVWYEKAAAQGHAQATNNLAYLYDMGLGAPQDRKKGFELYSKAADLGWAESMWNLANMYGAGQLGPKDMVMACVWSVRAGRFASMRDSKLKSHLERVIPQLEKMLPAADFARCKQQGEGWAPSGK
jgi:uncharacterized protein